MKFSVRGDGLVTVAAGLTVTAGGLSVSAGSATITTATSAGGSESALVVSASDGAYANNAAVLSVETATPGAATFYLFEVRARAPCVGRGASRGRVRARRAAVTVNGLQRARGTTESAASGWFCMSTGRCRNS